VFGLMGVRGATPGRIAKGRWRRVRRFGLWRPPSFQTGAPAANDATRDAHARRWPGARNARGAGWQHVGTAPLERLASHSPARVAHRCAAHRRTRRKTKNKFFESNGVHRGLCGWGTGDGLTTRNWRSIRQANPKRPDMQSPRRRAKCQSPTGKSPSRVR
jgi:hypothetical protein